MSDADYTKFHNELTAIFDGALGFAALQKKDMATAQKDLREAIGDESQPTITDIYPLATADLEAKPINPEGFWFAVRHPNSPRDLVSSRFSTTPAKSTFAFTVPRMAGMIW